MHLEKTFKTLITHNLSFSNNLSNAGITLLFYSSQMLPTNLFTLISSRRLWFFFMILKHRLKKSPSYLGAGVVSFASPNILLRGPPVTQLPQLFLSAQPDSCWDKNTTHLGQWLNWKLYYYQLSLNREKTPAKKKKKFFERVTMVPVPSHGGPATRKQKVLGERLSLGSLLSTSEQLLIVS